MVMSDEKDDQNIGCGGYLGIGILAMLGCGFAGSVIGKAVFPNDGMASARLTFLAGIDALLFVAICYSIEVQRKLPNWLAVAATLVVFGMKCGRGTGLLGIFAIGAINAALTPLAFVLWKKIFERKLGGCDPRRHCEASSDK